MNDARINVKQRII